MSFSVGALASRLHPKSMGFWHMILVCEKMATNSDYVCVFPSEKHKKKKACSCPVGFRD